MKAAIGGFLFGVLGGVGAVLGGRYFNPPPEPIVTVQAAAPQPEPVPVIDENQRALEEWKRCYRAWTSKR